MRSPFSMLECACEVEYATSRRRVAVGVDPTTGGPPAGGQDRDERGLARRALDHAAAVSLGRPEPIGQRQQLLHPVEHQRLDLGARRADVIQLMPWTPSPDAANSPRIEAYEMLAGEVGEELRVLPVRQARA